MCVHGGLERVESITALFLNEGELVGTLDSGRAGALKCIHVSKSLSAGSADLASLDLRIGTYRGMGMELVVACLLEHVNGSRSLYPNFEQ